ncbi:MAG: type I-E CRISPR-associated protein Cas7/Cse4/CasC [Deinococcus-Thermus bacterium]|jgi:CRISPR system Cascade subunit CasC|nr:MAG: type I-E CRISPR-associated protein Cas7/Cse4/CasC [Deinococcota bacterium]
MKHLLEIHILQNFAPSNLNRDDTGSPKDAIFGGYRRGRISSQCLKRAVRMYFKEFNLIEEQHRAERTKRLVQELKDRLVAKGKDAAQAEQAVITAITSMGSQKQFKITQNKAGEQLTDYLVFLGQKEIADLAEIILSNWETLTAKKATVSRELKAQLESKLDGGKAVDVALFGRMLANLPEKNQDAACQVAHAISTHAIEREFDFYTAVDDLKPDDNAGADMIGTVEFNSACYYRYAAIDLEKLRQNLQGDTELMFKGLEAFLKAFVKAKPSGKQNSFAAHNDPEYVAVTVRREADPRNLANAFEKPVRPSREKSLTEASVERLEAKWQKLAGCYGQNGQVFVLNLTDLEPKLGSPVKSLDELLEKTLETIRANLGV